MLFNSYQFFVFFIIVCFLYFFIPKKARCVFLLGASYYFYCSWNAAYGFLLMFITICTYLSGWLMEHGKNKKSILIMGIAVDFGVLAVFKYFNFFIENINHILQFAHQNARFDLLELVLPVGISFYVFQAVGYLADVYRADIQAERDIIKFGLFLSFFPQLVAGPIERSRNLLSQIKTLESRNVLNADDISDGIVLMLWGYFEKLVIADRCALFVNCVYADVQNFGFWQISAAVLFFSIQIYCDFDGYTNIARGAARILGIRLISNFRQPYFAGNIEDFWKRWHTSLTGWLTDYIYIPLGGSRRGRLITYRNLWIVFLISGLWHGASWHFVIWGMIHAVFMTVCKIMKNLAGSKAFSAWGGVFSILNFCLVSLVWIFFRADTVSSAFTLIRRLFVFDASGLSAAAMWSRYDWIVAAAGILLLGFVDGCREKGVRLLEEFQKKSGIVKATVLTVFLFIIILFGEYGAEYDVSLFLYFQF